jgi:hypothetical protein
MVGGNRMVAKMNTKKDWTKQTQDIFKCAIRFATTWQSKVYMRCAIEGCIYGNEFIDKEPREYCIYCGEKNPQILDKWMAEHIKPIKLK